MSRILVLQDVIRQYRVSFFGGLRTELTRRGHELSVIAGKQTARSDRRGDERLLDWIQYRRVHRLPGTGGRARWINLGSTPSGFELIVVPEAAGWLPTYRLLASRGHQHFRLGCWGHGPSASDHARNRATRAIRKAGARRFDHWFSYTDGTTRRLLAADVRPETITTVYNTIDVLELRRDLEQAKSRSDEIKESLAIRGPVALFLGALVPEKRLEVVLEAGRLIASSVKGFALVIAGEGPERVRIEAELGRSPWLKYVGPAFGSCKADLLTVAEILLQPAHLGLVVVDGMTAGVPILTFDDGAHSPEAEYLVHGHHGIRVDNNDVTAFASEATSLLQDANRRREMAGKARAAADGLTMAEMVRRFADGIEVALRAPWTSEMHQRGL